MCNAGVGITIFKREAMQVINLILLRAKDDLNLQLQRLTPGICLFTCQYEQDIMHITNRFMCCGRPCAGATALFQSRLVL